ncbi:MAG: CPBP family intramembrane glutamic endopeptidase [Liquorilactobacillus ghanensis]|uniref:CPBP family intramembrane glutamic endopeptidase n=1 Tax=Liquorilactobacillus ghanensis TaxID=399370 RepID=UPI0039EA5824
MKFKLSSKYRPIFLLLFFWLIEELTEDFIYGPLLDKQKSGSFLMINSEYKLLVMVTLVILNKVCIKQRIYFNFSTYALKNKLKSLIFLFIFIGYFVITPMLDHPERLREAFIIGLIAAIPEEYLFRGIILGNLLKNTSFISCKYKQIFICLLISSLTFSMAHISNITTQSVLATLLQIIQVFGYGTILGALYIKTGSLLFPIITHFTLDFAITLVNGTSSTVHGSFMINLIGTLIITVLCVIIAANIIKSAKKLKLFDKLNEHIETKNYF